MNLSGWALKNKPLIYFVVVLLAIGGLLSAYEMSKFEDPKIEVKVAMVVVTYPGASASQIELEAVDPLEKAILTMKDVDKVDTKCYNDYATMEVDLKLTTGEEDVIKNWNKLRDKVGDVSLPSGASVRVLDEFGDMYGMFYALTGDGLTDAQMKDYAELLKRELRATKGVGSVELYGERDECINVYIYEDRLANLGVTMTEVIMTLNGQDATVYTGYFLNGDNRIRVNVDNRFHSVDDISEMLIQGHEDDQLRLSDIARIEKDYAEPERNSLTYDGESAIGVLVSAADGTDVLKVGNAVEKTISRLQRTKFPAGVELHKVFYQPERVADSLNTFFMNLVESVLIVIILLMVFMGFRSGLIIGVSLILTVLGSFVFLYMNNGAMQRVSLAAFILAMGMLVDNSIVIVDGILVDFKAGKDRYHALTDIGKQTAMPLLGATMIAILAFLPLFLSHDSTGTYVRDLFIVLAVSLSLSWVLALFQVPLMADRLFDETSAHSGREMNKVEAALGKLLNFSLRHRWGVVAVMVLLLAISGLGYKYVKKGFFPDMTYNQLYMTYKLPEGVNSTMVRNDLIQLQDYLKTKDYITHITMSLGGTPGRYNLVRSIGPSTMSYGELIIDFTSPKDLVRHMDELQKYADENFPQAEVRFKRYNLMYKEFPVEAQFLGPDPAVLDSLTQRAEAIMKNCPYAEGVSISKEPDVPVISIHYNQPAARTAGFTRTDVSLSLLTATDGMPVGSFYDGIDKETINIKMVGADGKSIENLGNTQIFSQIPSFASLFTKDMLIKLRSGNIDKSDLIEAVQARVPLSQVCSSVGLEWQSPLVTRYNGQRSESARCFPHNGEEASKVFDYVRGEIESIQLPDGYSLVWHGEHEASVNSMSALFTTYPIAILLMFFILLLLFKDFKKPLIIFCTVPMLLIGVIAAMLLTGKQFGFVAIAGVLGLVGMIIKNAIVLMDEINLEISNGVDPYQALIQGSSSRLRSVSMAAGTTILGMVPLIPDAMFGSLAVSIMGGLTIGTILTLVFVPVLYSLFFRIRKKNGD
jgi:multidrug efflux pump subunit AcrB